MDGGVVSTWGLFWLESLWRSSWQGGLFILVVWVVCRFFARLPAALCAWFWWLACLKLLVGLVSPATLALSLHEPHPPATAARILPAILSRPETNAAADAITGLKSRWYVNLPAASLRCMHSSHRSSMAPRRRSSSSRPEATVLKPAGHRQPLTDWLCALLLALWTTGLVARLRTAGQQWLILRRLVHEARPLADGAVRDEAALVAAALGLRCPPSILESAAIPGPVVVGALHPTILLPAGVSARLSPRERQMVLAHELAHIRRHDLGLTFVPVLAQLLFFFHPLIWLAAREWGTAREAACDAASLEATGVAPAVYGRLLLKLVVPQRGAALPAIGASCGYRTMRRRLTMLRHPAPSRPRWLRASLALLIALVALGVVPLRLAAGPAEPGEPFAIDRVKELAKPITLTDTRIPLGDLVRKVSAETGVPLAATPDVADEPVAVVVNQYPAGKLLQELADLLDYRWHRRAAARLQTPNTEHPTPTYEIWQDLASKQREEALRQALREDALKQFQENLGKLVAMAEQPAERIRQIADAIEKDPAVRDLPVGSAKRNQWVERSGLAGRVDMPIPRALALLFGRLTPAEWVPLHEGLPIVLSTDPGPGELPLPEDIAQTFSSTRPSWLPPGQKPFLSHMPDAERLIAMMRQGETETQSRWAAATGFRVVLHLTGSRLRPGDFLSLHAQAEPLRGGAPDRIPHPIGTELMLTVGVGDSLIHREPDTPERQAALAKDPVVGAAKPFQTSKKQQAIAPPDQNGVWTTRRDQAWGRWDQLPELAGTYGVNFIADAYWMSGVQSAFQLVLPSSSAPVPLYKLLDDLVSGTHVWDRHGNLIRLRSRTWFLDRPREIPVRLIRRWNGLLEQEGALPLDEEGRIVTSLLRDEQLDTMNLLAFDGVLAMNLVDLRAMVAGKDTLRLYGALLPAQRETLWHGQPLPAARMTQAQRELLRLALERDDSRDVVLSDRELAAARFSITAEAKLLVVQRYPDRTTYRVEDPMAVRGGPTTPLPLAQPAGSPVTEARQPDPVRSYPALQITFRYQVGTQHFDLAPLTVAATDRT